MIIQIALLTLGFVMLIKGADWFVDGCADFAASVGISQMVIGLTIVAMGTSMPEAAVSITAAAKKTADIAVGNIIGSNILNILIILGLTALLIPIPVDKEMRKKDIPFMGLITIILLMMGYTGQILSRAEGVILCVLFGLYLFRLFRASKSESKLSDEDSKAIRASGNAKQILKDLLLILCGGAVVVAGSNIAVDAATEIAKRMGLSEKLIGLTIVALGTSLPELVTSLTAARKGNADIAIGNIVGSNIFNILFVLGISTVIIPIGYAKSFLIDNMIAVIAFLLLWGFSCWYKKLNRFSGITMLVVYCGYFVYLMQ